MALLCILLLEAETSHSLYLMRLSGISTKEQNTMLPSFLTRIPIKVVSSEWAPGQLGLWRKAARICHRRIICIFAPWWEGSAQKWCKNRAVTRLKKKTTNKQKKRDSVSLRYPCCEMSQPCNLVTWITANRKHLTEENPSPHVPPQPRLQWMAPLFPLSGSIKSCPHKQTSLWKQQKHKKEWKMEMRCPPSGPADDAPFQHFPNSQYSVWAGRYFDLAFCLGAAAAGGFRAGSAGAEGLTELYTLKHLHVNKKGC